MIRCRTSLNFQCGEIKSNNDFWLVTEILAIEVEFIETIQYRYKTLSSHLGYISIISDPMIAFCFVFPAGYYLSPEIGLLVVWTSAFADILTIVLKITFHEDRPYWWVMKNMEKVPNVSLAQYSLTCDVLPGGPSGHCLVTSAVYWTILTIMFKWKNNCEKLSLTFIYGAFMVLIAMSRIFLASNFPHQTLVGLFLGIALGNFVASTKLYNFPPVRYLYASAFIVILSAIHLYLSPSIGLSIKWTFCAANKYCYDTDWVSQNPFQEIFPFVRSAGILSGTGLSLLLTSVFESRFIRLKQNKTRRCVSTLLSITMISAFLCILSPRKSHPSETLIYYSQTFMEFLFIPVIVILLIPKLLKLYEFEMLSL